MSRNKLAKRRKERFKNQMCYHLHCGEKDTHLFFRTVGGHVGMIYLCTSHYKKFAALESNWGIYNWELREATKEDLLVWNVMTK